MSIKEFFKENPHTTKTANDIASIFNITRETASRHLNKFQKEGILEKDSNKPRFFWLAQSQPQPEPQPQSRSQSPSQSQSQSPSQSQSQSQSQPQSRSPSRSQSQSQSRSQIYFPTLDQTFEYIKKSTNPSAKTWQRQINKWGKGATIVFFHTIFKELIDLNLLVSLESRSSVDEPAKANQLRNEGNLLFPQNNSSTRKVESGVENSLPLLINNKQSQTNCKKMKYNEQ